MLEARPIFLSSMLATENVKKKLKPYDKVNKACVAKCRKTVS